MTTVVRLPKPVEPSAIPTGDSDESVILRHPTDVADLSSTTRAVVKRHLLAGLLVDEFEQAGTRDTYELQALTLLRQAETLCQLAEARAVRRDRLHLARSTQAEAEARS